jgi:16S rRNA (guanine527-N7)-methyltransferase
VTSPDERPPLPADAAATPQLHPAFATTLDADLAALGVTLSAGQRAAIDAHARLLLAWNASINLTALRRPEQVARDHVIDSLTALAIVGRPTAASPAAPTSSDAAGRRLALLDLGSGGGYPGIPLGVAARATELALVDSIGKKARFLEVAGRAAVGALRSAGEDAPAMFAIAQRAELLGRDPAHAARWDVVTARAVTTLADLTVLAFPLLRVGGRLIAWKREAGLVDELPAASEVIRRLGSDPGAIEVQRVAFQPFADHRLVIVTKTAPTPPPERRAPGRRRRAGRH